MLTNAAIGNFGLKLFIHDLIRDSLAKKHIKHRGGQTVEWGVYFLTNRCATTPCVLYGEKTNVHH